MSTRTEPDGGAFVPPFLFGFGYQVFILVLHFHPRYNKYTMFNLTELTTLFPDFIALAGFLIALSSFSMAVLMLITGKTRLHYIWSAFCFAVMIWGLGFFFIVNAGHNLEAARFWWKFTHVGAVAIPFLFTHFTYEFLKLKKPQSLIAVYILGTFFVSITLFSGLMIDHMRFVFNTFYYDSPPGVLYPIYVAYFFGLIIYTHTLLLRALLTSKDRQQRARIVYFFLATLIGFSGGGASFLPVFGIDLYPAAIITVVLYPLMMTYAILRYKLFNARFVVGQLLAFGIFIFTAIQFVLSKSPSEYAMYGALTIVAAILGIFLVKTIQKETEARDEVEKLAGHLEKANARLKELDKMKSEFVSIASHQLRSPLTSIRGYTSMILEGSYGRVPKKATEAVERIDEASRMMATLVEDYLDVSRIESGNMKYDCTTFNLREIVEQIVEDKCAEASKQGLELTFKAATSGPATIYADLGKTEQIIHNLLSNALKYTPQGTIKVVVHADAAAKEIHVDVIDSGIGMSTEDKNQIFGKFHRAKDANRTNTSGTGLGLFVSRAMAREMGGDVTAASDGPGLGSTFRLTMQLAG